MPRRKCIGCGYVGSDLALVSNYKCPKCGKDNPLGRQVTVMACFNLGKTGNAAVVE
jgi:predicted Zn-ribbon and HTH transcriptional regulator